MPISSTLKKSAYKPKALDRPFDPKILAEANRSVAEYQIAVRFDKEESGWMGRRVELPLCIGFGADPTTCVQETREVVAAAATMIENGEKMPASASDEQAPSKSICG